MPKFNETLTDTAYFELDDTPHQKGIYELYANSDSEQVGIYRVAKNGASTYLVNPTIFSNWTDSSDLPYASYTALVDAFKAAFFFS
jgi:hypothetical protein